eukprot:gene17066-36855_t
MSLCPHFAEASVRAAERQRQGAATGIAAVRTDGAVGVADGGAAGAAGVGVGDSQRRSHGATRTTSGDENVTAVLTRRQFELCVPWGIEDPAEVAAVVDDSSGCAELQVHLVGAHRRVSGEPDSGAKADAELPHGNEVVDEQRQPPSAGGGRVAADLHAVLRELKLETHAA